jgi:hypothetical protein
VKILEMNNIGNILRAISEISYLKKMDSTAKSYNDENETNRELVTAIKVMDIDIEKKNSADITYKVSFNKWSAFPCLSIENHPNPSGTELNEL